MNAQKLAICVSGTRTEAAVFTKIRASGNRIGSRDLDRDGSSMCSVSLAAARNSSLGATGVFKDIQ